MKTSRFLILAAILTVCFTTDTLAQDDGIWSSMKNKAKEAWNSDTRKEAWKKMKETGSELKEKTDAVLVNYQYKVPVTNRTFLDIIPESYIIPYSEKQYRQVVSRAGVSTHANETAKVNRVSQKLCNAAEQLLRQSDLDDELDHYKWEFNLIKGSTVNAFCMPGGKICVYEGMMPVASSDAMLAIVIGHEIGHAIAKHSAEQMTKRAISAAGMAAVIAALSTSDMSARKKKIIAILTAAGLTLADLKFSRNDEKEADRIGLVLAAMAGYDPRVAVEFWERMGQETGTGTRDWYSTHPSNSNRISYIKECLPEALEYYH